GGLLRHAAVASRPADVFVRNCLRVLAMHPPKRILTERPSTDISPGKSRLVFIDAEPELYIPITWPRRRKPRAWRDRECRAGHWRPRDTPTHARRASRQ